MPPRKRSIHIGVNAVDPAAYEKVPALLTAAEADARAMCALANEAGLDTTLLVGRDATCDAVSEALVIAAATLVAHDLLVFTFSGHGARIEDLGADEGDGFDESLCLRDGVLIDDHVAVLLARFAPGVRIYVLSDSCYSGTIVRHAEKLRSVPELRASVLLSAAAGENELCFTTEVRGLFTAAVLATWNDGRFAGDHLAFHAAIRARSAPGQVPALGRYGSPSPDFERARPFGAT